MVARKHLCEAMQGCRALAVAKLVTTQPLPQQVTHEHCALDADGHPLPIGGVEAGTGVAQHTQPVRQVHLRMQRGDARPIILAHISEKLPVPHSIALSLAMSTFVCPVGAWKLRIQIQLEVLPNSFLSHALRPPEGVFPIGKVQSSCAANRRMQP